ncbi:MAG: RsmE family RNA methyltransferase [Flavobacteriales bacterium]|jgi:16S rRNA (uracil1498-N3)-methyltransferase
MHWFYFSGEIKESIIEPDEEEQRHIRALRIREGEDVICTDGKGNVYHCKAELEKKSTSFRITHSEIKKEVGAKLTLAIAPTKNIDRLEWLIEKAVEVGVHEILLFKSEHSERPIIKHERLVRVAIAAMKQSQRAVLPHITPLEEFQAIIAHPCKHKYLAHCAEDQDKKLLQQLLPIDQDALIAIGPEGDFSVNEIQMAKHNGMYAVSLGDARLRTETAGLAAVFTFSLKNQKA